jgi:hypothetical protein
MQATVQKLRDTAKHLLGLAQSGELPYWMSDELAIEANALLTLADSLEPTTTREAS